MLRFFRKPFIFIILTLAVAIAGLIFESPSAHAASAITIDSPADGAVVGSGKLRISGVYTDLYDIKLFINGSKQVDALTSDPEGDNSGTWYYDLDTSIYNGPVQIRARGLDITTRYGIWSPTVQLNVNNETAAVPIVQIVSPLEGVSLNGEVPIQVAVQSAGAAIHQVEVRVNGGAWQTATYNGSVYEWVWSTMGLGDKTSSIEARAYNEFGVKGLSMTTYAKVGAGTNEAVVVSMQDRAMWLWEAATYNILLNPGSREVLDAMAKDTATFGSDPVKVLYFAVGPFDGMDVMEDNPGILRDFISWAHERGYEVHACIAGGTSPPYMGAYREFHDTAIRHFEQVLNFNISSNPEERFDGVNVDIEPYISPDFKDIFPSLQIQYLEMTQKMIDRRNATGLNLPYGPAIPKWYDTSEQSKDITFNGQTKWLSEHVQDITDYISIMNYRDTADGSAGIIAGAQGEIAYANLIGKPNSVVIGVETLDIANSGDPETITFREEGRNHMEAELDKVYTAFAGDASFGGIAMHHYDSIRALPSHWGVDGVRWEPPADNEAPTAPSRAPTARVVDFQTVTLTFGRSYDNTEVNHYVIYRSTQSDFVPSSGHTIGTARSLNFKDMGLLPDTTYYYKVAAVDVKGNLGPASEQAKATTIGSALKPMIVTSMKLERSATNAIVTLQVADMVTKQPISAEMEGRFTFAGGRYVKGLATDGKVSLTSEAIPHFFQVGFEPRRIVAGGYYWAQAYDYPHTANINPRVRLNDLSISQGSMSVPFTPEKAAYTAIVAEDTASIKVTPTAESSGTAIKVNGTPVQSGASSEAIPLTPGENNIVIQTFAPDATTDSYIVTVLREIPVDNVFIASEDAHVFQNGASQNFGASPFLEVIDITNADGGGDRLAYLKFDLGAYTKSADSVCLSVYAANTTAKDVKIDVIGYPGDDWNEGTIVFNNRPLANPVPMGSFVVRESGWYKFDVTSFAQTQMGLDNDRKVTIRFIINDIPKSSGALVQFHSKENNTNQPYLVVNPSSDASLSQLTSSYGRLEPDFNPERTSYSATVSDHVYGVALTPTAAESHAQVKVNGQSVGSGAASQEIPLVLGENPPITVEVTAQDGITTSLYTVIFTKEKSSNADLNNLSLIGASLIEPFAPDQMSYTAQVASGIPSVRVEAVAADSGARVWVNDILLSSDGLSSEVLLQPGSNGIEVRVEAASGNSQTYWIMVNREIPVYSAELTELSLKGVVLAPVFQSHVYSYAANVGYNEHKAMVKAVTMDAQATLSVNGKTVKSGSMVPVTLQVGSNRLEVKVSTPDQLERVYVVNVTKQEEESGHSGSVSYGPSAPSAAIGSVGVSAADGQLLIVPNPLRSKGEEGKAVDNITVDHEVVSQALEQAEAFSSQRLVISLDRATQDRADEWIVTLTPQALKLIADSGKELEWTATGVSLLLPAESIGQLGTSQEALNFRIAPLIQGTAHDQLLQRLSSFTPLLAAATGGQADWISTPYRIETNMTGKQANLRFPLPQEAWKTGPITADQLAVYVEHSDGETVLKPGRLYMDAAGKVLGVEITVNKFSTFTVIRLPKKEAAAYISGYEDGSFRPEEPVSRAEIAGMLDRLSAFRPVSNTEKAVEDEASFADVRGHWASEAITHLASEGVLAGYSDGAYMPENAISRAEIAVIISRWAGLSIGSGKETFVDTAGHWAQGEIAAGLAAGWLEGYEDGIFRPDAWVTRAEAVTLLNRVLKREPLHHHSSVIPWHDVSENHWAAGDLLSAAGLE
jgi:hypothetical protein